MRSAKSGRTARLLGRLVQQRPSSRTARELRREIEHELMRAIQAGGPEAARRRLDGVELAGHRLERAAPDGSLCTWRAQLDRHRRLEISVRTGGPILSTYVDYRTVRPVRLTPRQQRAAALQAAFYSRYERLGALAYRRGTRSRLSANERLVLLIGELEADVNNGGFGQYLANKGSRRARAALRALGTVRAKRTARWLAAALKTPTDSNALERLDARFVEHPEDLASLVMRYVGA